METIVLNSDGTSPYADPHEKLERVKEQLKTTLENVKMNIARDRNAMKPVKNNYNAQVSNKLNSILRREKFLDYSSAVNMPFEHLQDCYFAFLDLLDYIYEYCPEYVPTKVTFCGFVGTTTENYNKLRYSGNSTEIIELLSSADDLWYESVTSSAMANVSQSKASLDYAREKNKGLAIDLKSENTNTTNVLSVSFDPNNRAKLLSNILGNKNN
jgi:hypothetical protein